MPMLQEIFAALGFREDELRTYLRLLETGSQTASDLAKKLSLPRPTVYGYLERLASSGLVAVGLRRSIKIFTAETPDRIRLIFQRRIAELKKQEEQFTGLLPDLQKRMGFSLLRPRIQFFEGREGIESALVDFLNVPPGSMTLTFWPIKSMIDATSPDFFRYLNRARIQRRIYINAIWPNNQGVDVNLSPYMGTGEAFCREIRLAPDDFSSAMGYWIYGDKVVCVSSRAESYAFIVESAEFAHMMSVQHQIIWGLSQPLKPQDNKHPAVAAFLREVAEEYDDIP